MLGLIECRHAASVPRPARSRLAIANFLSVRNCAGIGTGLDSNSFRKATSPASSVLVEFSSTADERRDEANHAQRRRGAYVSNFGPHGWGDARRGSDCATTPGLLGNLNSLKLGTCQCSSTEDLLTVSGTIPVDIQPLRADCR